MGSDISYCLNHSRGSPTEEPGIRVRSEFEKKLNLNHKMTLPREPQEFKRLGVKRQMCNDKLVKVRST